jgi:hypothetical protein
MSDQAKGVDPQPDKTGKFLGIPYDWRRPTLARLKQRWWNPNDRRIITPKSFGWGFDLNLHELAARLQLVKRTNDGA